MMSKIYYIVFYDARADVYYNRAEDYGVWISKENADAEVNQRNAASLAAAFSKARRDYVTAVAKYRSAKADHDALVSCGLRTGEFLGRQPDEPSLESITVKDYYEVREYEVNDAT